MMSITTHLRELVASQIATLYGFEANERQIQISPTRAEFEGDFTLVVFPFTKAAKKGPEQIGNELGEALTAASPYIAGYNVIKGFLNLSLEASFWRQFLGDSHKNSDYGQGSPTGEKVMVEFCSPNTNKPLHLGHIRNILLGWSVSQLKALAGHEVIKVQIINDRGIAICKSMLAWKKFGEGATPASTNTKPDHFVGEYYVLFDQALRAEYAEWQKSEQGQAVFAEKAKPEQEAAAFFKAYKDNYFNEYSELGQEAREMLLAWEANDPEVRQLWETMNGWVYEGFATTYDRLGVSFDQFYYESKTYLRGKELVEEGMEKGIFYRDDSGAVMIDLTDVKMDQKVVLRSDGTAMYITQDLGTADVRYQDHQVKQMTYVVGDEQEYHFKVLFEIMKRLDAPYADGLYHLSYGMVDLPSGKMKSREGTVVDADDLIAEITAEARAAATEQGVIANLEAEEQKDIIRKIGLAALKFFIIKVSPKKRMVFDPKESVDLQGQTGPYVQYAYVRTQGVLERAEQEGVDLGQWTAYEGLEDIERTMLRHLYAFPTLVQEAAANYDPSSMANYCYDLAKLFSKFWHDLDIFRQEEATKAFRLCLCELVGHTLRQGMRVLGIEMPRKM